MYATIKNMHNLPYIGPNNYTIAGCIMGTDQANNIRKFKNSRKLINSFPFFIVNRAGHKIYKGSWYTKEPHVILPYKFNYAVFRIVNSSSIREFYAYTNSKSIFVSPLVHKYIIKHNLYKN